MAGTYPQKIRTFHSAAEFAQRTAGKVAIERRADGARLAALRATIASWLVTEVTVIGSDATAGLWIGTTRGAIRYTDGYRRHEYFAGL